MLLCRLGLVAGLLVCSGWPQRQPECWALLGVPVVDAWLPLLPLWWPRVAQRQATSTWWRVCISFTAVPDPLVWRGADLPGTSRLRSCPRERLRRGAPAVQVHRRWPAAETSSTIGLDGTIYIGRGDGILRAIDPVDGSEKWRFETIPNSKGRGQILSGPAIGADGTIYFGTVVTQN